MIHVGAEESSFCVSLNRNNFFILRKEVEKNLLLSMEIATKTEKKEKRIIDAVDIHFLLQL